jgi:hypothetical protein
MPLLSAFYRILAGDMTTTRCGAFHYGNHICHFKKMNLLNFFFFSVTKSLRANVHTNGNVVQMLEVTF